MRRSLLIACTLLLLSGPAARLQADETLEQEAQNPWAATASPTDRASAIALFASANERFIDGDHKRAVVLYEQALALWDHPTIHYNLAQAYVQLDRLVDAHEHVARACALRETVPGDAKERAQTLRATLEKQLARLTIISHEPGAQILLDGAPAFAAPGQIERMLLPGDHGVIAKRAGRMTTTRTLRLLPGAPVTVSIETLALPEKRLERRWPAWKPWALVGASAALALVGTYLEFDAISDMREHDRQIDELCRVGCAPTAIPDSIHDLKSHAETKNVFGLALIGAGTAGVATGAFLIYLNAPRVVEVGAPTMSAPMESLGVGAQLRF